MVNIDSTSFIWMGVYNASLHPLESVEESILIELYYTVLGNLVNIRARQPGLDLMGPHIFVLTTCDDNLNVVYPHRAWKECQ